MPCASSWFILQWIIEFLFNIQSRSCTRNLKSGADTQLLSENDKVVTMCTKEMTGYFLIIFMITYSRNNDGKLEKRNKVQIRCALNITTKCFLCIGEEKSDQQAEKNKTSFECVSIFLNRCSFFSCWTAVL